MNNINQTQKRQSRILAIHPFIENQIMKSLRHGPIRTAACFGGALLGGASLVLAQDAGSLDKLEKKIRNCANGWMRWKPS